MRYCIPAFQYKINMKLFAILLLTGTTSLVSFSAFTQNNIVTNKQVWSAANPFFSKSTLPYQAPPFNKIKNSDFKPALEAGMKDQLATILKIANNPKPATFENTLVAMEKSNELLDRVDNIFNFIESRCLIRERTFAKKRIIRRPNLLFSNYIILGKARK